MKHYAYLIFLLASSCINDPVDDSDSEITDVCDFDIFNLVDSSSIEIDSIQKEITIDT